MRGNCGSAPAIGFATLRRDGYISYTADADEGVLQTRPIRFREGRRLFINADTRGGEVRVSVCRVNQDDEYPRRPNRGIKYDLEDVLPGYADSIPVTQDATRAAVTWADRDELPAMDDNEWISLRFTLRNASLYSFWTE